MMSISAGIVVCGGYGKRMGEPKPWVRFGDSTLLQIVASKVASICSPVVLVGGGSSTFTQGTLDPQWILAQDRVADRGPLEGLIVGLHAVKNDAIYAFACGCDNPFLVPTVIDKLVGIAAQRGLRGLIPTDGKRHYPLCGVYRVDLISKLDELQQRTSRLQAVATIEGIELISIEYLRDVDPNLRSLENLNTPADLEAAKIRFLSDSFGVGD